MTRWLASLGVTHVAMEATGICTMAVFRALVEPGCFEQVLVCSAAHVKNVPGRKTGAVDGQVTPAADGSSTDHLRVACREPRAGSLLLSHPIRPGTPGGLWPRS